MFFLLSVITQKAAVNGLSQSYDFHFI